MISSSYLYNDDVSDDDDDGYYHRYNNNNNNHDINDDDDGDDAAKRSQKAIAHARQSSHPHNKSVSNLHKHNVAPSVNYCFVTGDCMCV